MPYKDIEKRRECRRRWYTNNKDSELAHIKNRKIEIRKWFDNLKKNLKCSKCSENHPSTIEFHHNQNKKEMNVSKMVSEGYSIDKIQREIEKCIILCSNCHRKEHYKNNNL